MFLKISIFPVIIVAIPLFAFVIIATIIYKNRHDISKSIDDISSDIEKHIKNIKESTSNQITCPYCKTKYDKSQPNCKNCGARNDKI